MSDFHVKCKQSSHLDAINKDTPISDNSCMVEMKIRRHILSLIIFLVSTVYSEDVSIHKE